MKLYPVYSPSGEMFEVSESRLQKLVLEDGWTQSKPSAAPPPEEPHVRDIPGEDDDGAERDNVFGAEDAPRPRRRKRKSASQGEAEA